MKTCSKCKIEKELAEFHKYTKRKNGRSHCKSCVNNLSKKYYSEHKKEKYQYYLNNKERLDFNKLRHRRISDKYKQYNKDYQRNKRKTNIQFKLAHNLRIRLNTALKRNFKSGSFVNDCGITITNLKNYIENQFKPNMSWENHGKLWHIDHIKPLASFDLTDRSQFLQACHYTNLTPLYANENLKKGSKILQL